MSEHPDDRGPTSSDADDADDADGTNGAPDDKTVAQKALDLLVFAPTGLVVTAVEDLPELAAKGRARLEEQVRNAHVVGRMVVTLGRRDLKHRLEQVRGSEQVPETHEPTDPASPARPLGGVPSSEGPRAAPSPASSPTRTDATPRPLARRVNPANPDNPVRRATRRSPATTPSRRLRSSACWTASVRASCRRSFATRAPLAADAPSCTGPTSYSAPRSLLAPVAPPPERGPGGGQRPGRPGRGP